MALETIQLSANIGTGDTLAADTLAGGEKVQYVKLINPLADNEGIVGEADNGTAATAMRVTVASDSTGQVKLAAGTATVGTANLGSFDTTAATSPATVEDQASATGDMGLKILARRTATPADTSGTDLDYEMLQMDNGKLWTQTGGSVAHDAALAANDNPILNGGVAAEMDGTTLSPAAVIEGDITYFRTDRDGRQLTNASHPASASYNLNSSSAQTATVVKTAPGAGFSIYITGVHCSALTAQTLKVHDEDDNVLIPIQYYGANTGHVRLDLSANPIKLVANKALEFTSTAAVAHSTLVTYFVAP